ncbi:MAG: glycosyltransferase family 4 protein [Bacteroidales bacterium]|nr:glycosyltransferase family 4 protein [Bacteroidales bacterium]
MKVIIPFPYYYPETCAGIFVVDDMMHALAELGIISTIYVPTPTRNVSEGADWKRDEWLHDGKIHIHRFRMFAERKNPVLRALRYLFCECFYMHHMLWDEYDVSFIDSTPPIQGLKLPIVKFFRKKPVVYNVQDLFPETLTGSGLANQRGLLWMIGSLVAKITFSSSDKIIAISEEIKKNLIKKGVPAEKVDVVYNWVDESVVTSVADDENPLFKEYGIKRNKFRVVYAGNLGNAQNINIIVEAASELKENLNIEFVIFGKGGLENEIKERIEKECLFNIVLLPLQPVERAKYVYSLGNVCIVACKAGFGGYVLPSKTWSIMACGRPVLVNFDEGELKCILESYQCGIFTKAGDLQGFVSAIENFAKDPKRCSEMGANGRKFILENLTKEVGTQKYVNVVKKLIRK